MKKSVFILSAVLAIAAACQKSETPADDGGETLAAPKITVTPDAVTIKEISDDHALKIEWSAASEKSNVSYSLLYGIEGSESKILNCGTSLSKSFTAKELDAVRAELGIAEATGFSLSVSVEAKSSSVLLPVQSDAVKINVVYDISKPDPDPEPEPEPEPEPVVNHYYGIGEPFAWAWKLADAEEFTTSDQKTYVWSGDANAGGFKIMLSNTDWSKGYNWDKAKDNGVEPTGDEPVWSAFLRDETVSKENDDYFKFPKDGSYTVTFDSEALTVTVKYNGKRSDWKPDTNYDMDGMYMYGPWGWGLADVKAMTTTDNDSYVYEGELKKGDLFKFMCKSGKWWPAFVPDSEDKSKMVYHKTADEGDGSWLIDEDGQYRVTAVISELSVTIEKL